VEKYLDKTAKGAYYSGNKNIGILGAGGYMISCKSVF